MLLGVNIHVFTDHKNLTFDTLKTRVLCWHTKIEEFLPMLHYIKGPHNILADKHSRLHPLVTLAQIAEGKKLVELAEVSIEEEDKAYFLDQEYSVFMMRTSGNALSATSTYLTLHIRMRIR
jgi:hypothetical protein